jgi:hypothetical protein
MGSEMIGQMLLYLEGFSTDLAFEVSAIAVDW